MRLHIQFSKGFTQSRQMRERVLGGIRSGVARLARRLAMQSKLPLERKALELKPNVKREGDRYTTRIRVMRGRMARLGLGRKPMFQPKGGQPTNWSAQRLSGGRQVIGTTIGGRFQPMYLRRRPLEWAGPSAGSRSKDRKRAMVAGMTQGLRR